MELPPALISAIREGNVCLFLGAGASIGAKDGQGRSAPSTRELVNQLDTKYLGGKYSTRSLQWVSQMAISETNLGDVQEYIASLLKPIEPATHHLILPTFKWHGIATTNYDQLVEKSYQHEKSPIQKCTPIISNDDRLSDLIRSPEQLMLLKLHGCISRTRDENIPFILTPDQYVDHLDGRSRLFDLFEEWGREHPVVFIGHELEDSDVRSMLNRLEKKGLHRPRYYLVKPNVVSEESRFWESKRISALPGKYADFLEEVSRQIPLKKRILLRHVEDVVPIRKRFVVRAPGSESLQRFIRNSVDYVHPGMKIEPGKPEDFYRGFDLGWYSIDNDLDVRRSINERLLFDLILIDDADRPSKTDFYSLMSEAGGGKSIALRRLAWNAGIGLGALCLFHKLGGWIDYDPIKELSELVNERIFLFIDNTADNVKELEHIAIRARADGLEITIITAERVNAWNIFCEDLDYYVNRKYRIKYLDDDEIVKLLGLLNKYKSLGQLKHLGESDRVKAFQEIAGRQLLVALHEATLGKPFEDIIVDEYNEIIPESARNLYLTICVLNRHRIFVRAGLISRIHSIAFESFRDEFFKPLDHVVRVRKNELINDYMYTARHPEIAQIVFQRVLRDGKMIYAEYMRIIDALNLLFDSDRRAFRQLVRGKNVVSLLSNQEDARALYKKAIEVSGEDAFVYHQNAIYETNAPDGDLDLAANLLDRALVIDQDNPVIMHTSSEIALRRATRTDNRYEKEKYISKAILHAMQIIDGHHSSTFARHSVIKAFLLRLELLLESMQHDDAAIIKLCGQIEHQIERANQSAPNESYIADAEAKYRQMMQDSVGATTALERAIRKNPQDSYIALRLSKVYRRSGRNEDAQRVLESALQSDRGNKELNFHLAMVLRGLGDAETGKILYYLRRSFTKWDKSFEAQFWLGRYCFESEDQDVINEGREVFRRLRASPISYDKRMKIKDHVTQGSDIHKFTGTIVKLEGSYGFIKRDGFGDEIFFHENHVADDIWPMLSQGQLVRFEIGFSLNGPIVTRLVF